MPIKAAVTAISVSVTPTDSNESQSKLPLGEFTEGESSRDKISASTDKTHLETPTAAEQPSVQQTFATTTFSSKIDTEHKTVTTSPYTLETSQPLAIPSITTVPSNEMSSFIDMEGSSGSSGDDLEFSADGSGEEPSPTTTFKPQVEFILATDETETEESESTSDISGAASSTPSSTQLTEEFMSSTQTPHMPITVAATKGISVSSSAVAVTDESSSDQTKNTSRDDAITQTPTGTTASSLYSTDKPTSTVQSSSTDMFSETSSISSSAVYNTESPDSTTSTASSLFSTEKPTTTTSLYSIEKLNITSAFTTRPAQSAETSPSTPDESKQTPDFPVTEEGSSGDQTTEVFTVKPSGIESVTFGEATGETETFVSVTPTSDEQVSSQEAKIMPDTPYTSQATEPPASSYTLCPLTQLDS
ncbi:cell wall protein DAN4-like [Hippoglossus hippoglossus]|uniref:cell wall protein DAN4-like n=1 Tax=Hippoglossus hippoglossus TaxID=8267 RepID=UPI00148CD847|nr:cell wall protein DAN4-like [Hippoglossus hippoglossus]